MAILPSKPLRMYAFENARKRMKYGKSLRKQGIELARAQVSDETLYHAAVH